MKNVHRLFFCLTIILLPTQLGRHFWPEWALVLGRRVDYLSPTLYFTDILIVLTIVSWFISVLSRFKNYDLRITKRKIINHKSLFIILLTLFVCINVYVAGSKLITIYFWLKALGFAMFGYYIIKIKPRLSDLTLPLSIAIFYSSTIAIIQSFLQHSIGGVFWLLGERTFSNQTPGIAQINLCMNQCRLLLRPYATFPHPNVLGGFLAITIPILIYNFQFTIFNKTKKFTIFKLLTVILGFIALFLAFSRSAWLIGALSVGWVFMPNKLKKPYVLFSVLAFVLGIFLVSDFAGTSESVVVREQLNGAATTLWQRSPLFGIGLGNFLINLPAVLPSRIIYFLQPVHNIYLLLLAETGVVGLVAFLIFLYRIFRKFYLTFDISHLSLLSLLLLGLVDHYLFTLQQGQLLFTFFLSFSFVAAKL